MMAIARRWGVLLTCSMDQAFFPVTGRCFLLVRQRQTPLTQCGIRRKSEPTSVMGLASEEHGHIIKGAKVHRARVIRAQQLQQCETVLGDV